MTSTRPYLIRAFHEWILDNENTPYILVDALKENLVVPEEYIEDNKIILNLSTTAVRELTIDNEYISFNARFSGVPMDVFVPIEAILAIYAKETGKGMVFTGEEDTPPSPLDPKPTIKIQDKPKSKLKPTLTVVK